MDYFNALHSLSHVNFCLAFVKKNAWSWYHIIFWSNSNTYSFTTIPITACILIFSLFKDQKTHILISYTLTQNILLKRMIMFHFFFCKHFKLLEKWSVRGKTIKIVAFYFYSARHSLIILNSKRLMWIKRTVSSVFDIFYT